jgi:two-component system, cell cycle sensor histidine kinase and response regulator CckA
MLNGFDIMTGNKTPEGPAACKGKILIMDDDEIFCNFIRRTLIRLGYVVEITGDGSDALEIYRKAIESGYPFNAVIVDLVIQGGMGGDEAIKQLLLIDPDANAIVSSGHSLDPHMTNYKEYGFKGALSKPYSIEELRNVLSTALRGNE